MREAKMTNPVRDIGDPIVNGDLSQIENLFNSSVSNINDLIIQINKKLDQISSFHEPVFEDIAKTTMRDETENNIASRLRSLAIQNNKNVEYLESILRHLNHIV